MVGVAQIFAQAACPGSSPLMNRVFSSPLSNRVVESCVVVPRGCLPRHVRSVVFRSEVWSWMILHSPAICRSTRVKLPSRGHDSWLSDQLTKTVTAPAAIRLTSS